MSLQAVLLPLFVEVILTFVLMLLMGALRGVDFRSGAVKPTDVALREANWPKRTTQAADTPDTFSSSWPGFLSSAEYCRLMCTSPATSTDGGAAFIPSAPSCCWSCG
jgi:hypothetical protein